MERQLNLKLKAKGTLQEYSISLPNGGQLVDVENLKITLSVHYRALAEKNSILSNLALDIVDMQAYFSILCPQLIADLSAPIAKLDLVDILELRDVYEKQFLPWWNPWIKLIQGVPELPKKSEKDSVEYEEDELQVKENANTSSEGPVIDLN